MRENHHKWVNHFESLANGATVEVIAEVTAEVTAEATVG